MTQRQEEIRRMVREMRSRFDPQALAKLESLLRQLQPEMFTSPTQEASQAGKNETTTPAPSASTKPSIDLKA